MNARAMPVAAAVIAAVATLPSPQSEASHPIGDGELVDWMLDHPEQVSIVVSGGAPSGELQWNGAIVRPLASTFKTIVLAAYAREAASGRVDPDEVVPIEEISRWLIEGTDGGSHAAMLERYGTGAGVRLDDVAAAMIAYSANTAADVLLDRLGRNAIAETVDVLGLPSLATAAAPPAGAVGLLGLDDLGSSAAARLDTLASMDAEAVDAAAWERSDAFAAAPGATAADTLEALAELASWDLQLRLSDTLPWRASPTDMHDLLVRVLVEERLGAEATEIVRAHLSWPLEDAALAARFSALTAKEGAAPGTLAVHGMGRPRAGGAAGVARTIVLSVHGLDYEAWTAQVESGSLQALALTLIDEPDAVTALATALER
jgi:beta-lactamase class A